MLTPIALKTMPNTTIGSDGYDEVSDVYPTPTDAERLAYVEGQVKQLWRAVGAAIGHPNRRSTGGAVDRDILDKIVMGGK